MIIDTPDKGPYAAAALIIDYSGLFLGVSRKYDQTDFGLPGGKLEPDQNFADACTAEVEQETGLQVIKMKPIFGARCGTEGVHRVHWNLTFLCKVEGYIHTKEKGKVAWVPTGRLLVDEWGKPQAFAQYNRKLFQRIKDGNISLDGYISQISFTADTVLYDGTLSNPDWLRPRFKP